MRNLGDTDHVVASKVQMEEVRTVRVADAGLLTWGAEDLVIEPGSPVPGRAVCVRSGNRLAFRRVLGVSGSSLRLRADVAPFEDAWSGEIVGCVRPRLIDRIAAVDVERWTRTNWNAAFAYAHVLAARKRLTPKRRVTFDTRAMDLTEWPRVRAFWKRACGRELPIEAQPRQHVIGLFPDGNKDELVGANIRLVFGNTAYSAYTLVDRRYRGCGGGAAMIKQAVAASRAQRLESLYVHINARNLPSITAYSRAGFVDKGWWTDDSDPLAAAERQWRVLELEL